jgi:hypothetical protein
LCYNLLAAIEKFLLKACAEPVSGFDTEGHDNGLEKVEGSKFDKVVPHWAPAFH